MSVLTEDNLTADFAVQPAQPPNRSNFQPRPEDGARLIRAFVSIRSPEQRRAVLEYVVEQARMDKPLGGPEGCVPQRSRA